MSVIVNSTKLIDFPNIGKLLFILAKKSLMSLINKWYSNLQPCITFVLLINVNKNNQPSSIRE